MNVKGITPILNVSNLPESFSWFEKLGWIKCWEYGSPPTFGAVGCGAVQIFLCENGQGSQDHSPPRFDGDDASGGVWMSWWVGTPDEVDDVCRKALAEGMVIIWPPTDEPWGVRECRLRHPDGHTFRISSGRSLS